MAARHVSRALELARVGDPITPSALSDAEVAHLYLVRAGSYIDQRNLVGAGDVVRPDHLEHAVQHLLDDVADAQRFAGGRNL